MYKNKDFRNEGFLKMRFWIYNGSRAEPSLIPWYKYQIRNEDFQQKRFYKNQIRNLYIMQILGFFKWVRLIDKNLGDLSLPKFL